MEFFLILKSFNFVLRKFKWFLKGVSRKFQKCFKQVSRVSQGSFRENSRIFQESKDEEQVVQMGVQGYWKEI